jgi:2-polyprenyl-3-methyl-5-hydroxy-6-metoxy-1,4-benzoquinol methylase
MTGCCDPRDCDAVFTPDYARRTARKLRTTGLDDTATRMVEYLVAGGLEGASILEIGGGVGGLHIELLRRGASRATNLELSSAYEVEAARMLGESGFEDRVDRRLVNIANEPEAIDQADVVVLHRVVCCYPDYEGLLGAAADHARRMLIFSYPRPHLLTRAQTAFENIGYAVRRQDFRTFVHSPDAMVAVLADHGLEVTHTGRNRMWQYNGTVRRT